MTGRGSRQGYTLVEVITAMALAGLFVIAISQLLVVWSAHRKKWERSDERERGLQRLELMLRDDLISPVEVTVYDNRRLTIRSSQIQGDSIVYRLQRGAVLRTVFSHGRPIHRDRFLLGEASPERWELDRRKTVTTLTLRIPDIAPSHLETATRYSTLRVSWRHS